MNRSAHAGLLALAGLLTACGDDAPSRRGLAGVSSLTPFTSGCDQAPPSTATLYTNAEAEPFIAVNPLDAANLVGVWQQDRWSNGGARGVLAAASTDGGATWTTAQIPFSRCSGGTVANGGDYAKATDPWVSFGADGIAYFMALSFSSQPSAMLVSRSTDGGLTWDPPHTLVLSNDPDLFHDKNSITADPYEPGHAYAIWDRFDFNTLEAPIFFSRTTDGGESWEESRIIYDPGIPLGTIGSQIVVLPDGTLVNLFTESNRDTDEAWFSVIRSTDQGVNWSTPTTIADILAVGTYDPVTNKGVRAGAGIGSIAVGPTGMLYLVWQDGRFSGGVLDGIALSMSADGGLSWTEPVQVNAVDTADAFTPSVAVAPDGTIGVTYYDWRHNTETESLPTSYWLATSTDGVTWAERPVADDFDLARAAVSGTCCYFLGDYQSLVATADEFLAFFVGTNNSTTNRSDARFSALPVDATTAKRAYAARPAPRFAMTPEWRARNTTQIQALRKAPHDRVTPEYLRRR